ncbi:desmoglein-2-like isoform X2 [Parambassis ranga]|nr:desmoglein-2-like isoform X2 [Parambassis ranga]
MQLEGKDKDQPGTINSQISYTIISQEPRSTGHMFTLDKMSGKLYVKEPTLDRETHDFYKLIIKVTDMGGAEGGLTGTGTVEIKVLDINDNLPTLEKSEYSGSVDENVVDVVVMKIKALDKDLIHTDNWLTVFKIVNGNEDNLFSIETDKETNEGILKLIKPVDFEEVQNLELGLLIENVAPPVKGAAVLMDVNVQVGEGGPIAAGTGAGAGAASGAGADLSVNADLGIDSDLDAGVNVDVDADLEGSMAVGLDAGLKPEADLGPGVGVKPGAKPGVGVGLKPKPKKKPKAQGNSYPIKIAVNNVPEGPAFVPDTKNVPVSEDPKDAPENGTITVFAAVDPDTGKPAEDVSYAKAYDPDNWFTIDEETAEIKLNMVPDRESPFLVNGTYFAKILAITKDMPSKTATGTIAIQVIDSNDHCPKLTTTHSRVCSDEKTVYVTALDEDASPNAAPYTFRIIPDGTRGSWDVEVLNETSAALHAQESLWPGSYELQVEMLDAQGLACPVKEVFTVDVCTCVGKEDCTVLKAARLGMTSADLSAPAIGLLIMALCLLLFIPLFLLFCQCGGAKTIFPDQFSDLPFDTKEHLISYHTEGKGEEAPLQRHAIMLGTQNKVEAAPAPNHIISSAFTETQQTATYNESVQTFQERFSQNLMEVDNAYESFNHGNVSATFNRQTLDIQHMAALYEDIALPEAFLKDYYSQKALCNVPMTDSLLEYDFEGQGSSAGSIGCCSLLESDNDLHFLTDVGPKFKMLAEICSPLTPSLQTHLANKIVAPVKITDGNVKPVSKPTQEHISETSHNDMNSKKIVSTTNILKSSVSMVGAPPPPMTLPRSEVTNISHSSSISRSATLPYPAHPVVLQQQSIYYTTTPVLQPSHYVVEPHLQNSLLLADGSSGTNLVGLYIVRGPQSPSGLVSNRPQGSPSGLLIQDTGNGKGPKSPTNTSPINPTLLIPGSPVVPQGSVLMADWKIMGPNAVGKYILPKDQSRPEEGFGPGSSQGTLPSGAVLVKETAPPQGVFGLAARGGETSSLPRHIVTKKGDIAVNRPLEQTWIGHKVKMELGPNVLGLGTEQPGVGIGPVVIETPEDGIRPALDEKMEDTVTKKLSKQNVITSTPEDKVLNRAVQTCPESSTLNTKENAVELLPGQVLHNHLDKITKIPTNKCTDVTNVTNEYISSPENADKRSVVKSEKKCHVSSSKNHKSLTTQISSTEAFSHISDATILFNTNGEKKETSMFPRGEESTSTEDHNIVDDEIRDCTEHCAISPTEKGVSDFENNLVTTSTIQKEENIEMPPATSEIRDLGNLLEAMPELQVNYRDGDEEEIAQAETETDKAKALHQTDSTILTDQEKGDHSESCEVQIEGTNIQTVTIFEQHLLRREDGQCGYSEANNEQNISVSVDWDPLDADSVSVTGEANEEIILEEVSQQSMSNGYGQHGDRMQ